MCLRENLNVLGKIQKSTSFSDTVYKYCKVFVPIEKEVTNLIKMVMKVLSLYLTKQNLLIVQDLWQLHYQILLITSQKEFTKLNVKIVIRCVYLVVQILQTKLMKN